MRLILKWMRKEYNSDEVYGMSSELERFQLPRVSDLTPPFYSFSLFEKTINRITANAEQNTYKASKRPYKTLASPHEYSLGMYMDAIQQQIKKAVLTLHKKGYQLHEWGFGGLEKETQYLDGIFRIEDKEAKKKLQDIDVRVDEYEFEGMKKTELYFRPERPYFKEVKDTWNEIAEILPDTGNEPQNRYHPDAFDFRRSHYILTSAYLKK